jgi:hypothetical protein
MESTVGKTNDALEQLLARRRPDRPTARPDWYPHLAAALCV